MGEYYVHLYRSDGSFKSTGPYATFVGANIHVMKTVQGRDWHEVSRTGAHKAWLSDDEDEVQIVGGE